jgi:hypothetical protein
MFRHGPQTNHFRKPYATTFALVNSYGFITPVSIVRYFGMSYAKILMCRNPRSNSSTAPPLKRALIASRGLSKTSVAPSAATCERTIEEASLYVFYQYPALMDHLTTIPNFWEK